LGLAIGLCDLPVPAFGQQDSLINSGKVINRAEALYDSGQYKSAITWLRKIDPRDTNYQLGLTHLILNLFETDNYSEALTQCELGLAAPSEYRPRFLRYRAMAYGFSGNYERADQLFNEAALEFPFNPDITYQHGLLHYRAGHYAEAEKSLFGTLQLNPYHSGSHLYLARLAIRRGEKVKGMFSMGIYLAINNKVNEQLVVLEHFVKNELTDEQSIPSMNNPFERLDDFIRARIAMEPAYEQTIPIDAGLVRQYQFLFEQLGSMSFSGEDPWIQFYLPLYQGLRKNNLLEPFVYHILNSSNISSVPVWTRKNSQKLEEFYKFINEQLNGYRNVRNLNGRFGYAKPVSCWYLENGSLEAIGDKERGDVRIGKWIFYASNGFKLAEGPYTLGKKSGVWHYFNDKGEATSIENYDTGTVERLDPNGTITTHYRLKGEDADGKVLKYFPCGSPAQEMEFSAGIQQGISKSYYPNGQVEEEFGVRNDSLQGAYKVWYDNGAKKTEKAFDRGGLTGQYVEYYRNGKIKFAGINEKGMAQGEWTYYSERGKLTEKRIYKNDKKILSTIFDATGKISEDSHFDEEGKLHGDTKNYHEGLLWYTSTFDHGKPRRFIYYDKTGKVLADVQELNHELKGKAFYPTGQVNSEFLYRDGLAEGAWTFYHRSGVVSSRYQYSKDQLEGEGITYHESGAIKLKTLYVQGKLHGLYKEYYPHGTIKIQGWYQDDKQQQQWISYFPGGSIESDQYYLNDVIQGYTLNYAEDGSLIYRSQLNKRGEEIDFTLFGPKQKELKKVSKKDKTRSVVESLSIQGKVMLRATFLCDKADGQSQHFFPDGTVCRTREYHNGQLQGNFSFMGIDGSVVVEGGYDENKPSGKWTWYQASNTKSSEGYYLDGEDDSTWTAYYFNGQPATISQFRNGVREGLLQWFAPSGAHLLDKWYNRDDAVAWRTVDPAGNAGPWIPFSGTGKIKVSYPGGVTALEETYKDFYLDGERTMYYANGQPYSKYQYKNNMYWGGCYQYHPNGKIQKKMNYINDELNGELEIRHPDGSLMRVEHYKDGTLSGMVELYDNGKKIKEVRYLNNLPIE
jgi:antitoxin component YwqK of YwqJK toxin-antitoxin module